MISVHRAADRFVSEYDGIVSRHSFSAGAHYDPANTSFHGLVAVDEHVVPVGGGFSTHAHRGVDIVSWVLDGVLRHEDDSGHAVDVTAGSVQLHSTGPGVRHSEVNGSDVPLRFVQMTLLHNAVVASHLVTQRPLQIAGGTFTVHRIGPLTTDGPVHLFVARGSYVLGDTSLGEGDSVRADEPLTVDGDGELLVWRLP